MLSATATIIKESDEWVVVLIEDGNETRKGFKIHQHALNWLDGQRVRLGLDRTAPPLDASAEPQAEAGL